MLLYIVAEDEKHDIVALKMGRNPFKESLNGFVIPASATIIDEHFPKDGHPIFVSGYPLGFPSVITTSGYIASSDPIRVDLPANLQSVPLTDLKVEDIFWGDIQANHGNSGGPVFSRQTGAAIGMQVAVMLTRVEFYGGGDDTLGAQRTPQGQLLYRPIGYNSGIAQIIPVRYIATLLREHKIQFNVKP